MVPELMCQDRGLQTASPSTEVHTAQVALEFDGVCINRFKNTHSKVTNKHYEPLAMATLSFDQLFELSMATRISGLHTRPRHGLLQTARLLGLLMDFVVKNQMLDQSSQIYMVQALSSNLGEHDIDLFSPCPLCKS